MSDEELKAELERVRAETYRRTCRSAVIAFTLVAVACADQRPTTPPPRAPAPYFAYQPACPSPPPCPACVQAPVLQPTAPVAAQPCPASNGKLTVMYPSAPQWNDPAPLSDSTVTCDFRIDSWVGLERGLVAAWSGKSAEPTVITFTGLNTKKPAIKGNLGTGSVLKTQDDGTNIFLLEPASAGNVITYAINRRARLAVFTKTYFVNDQPLGYLMLGRCY